MTPRPQDAFSPRERWLRWGPFAVIPFATVWFFSPLLAGRVIYERDVFHVWHGQMEAIVRGVAAGTLPLWDPTASFGEPLMALPAQVLYPFTWLGFVISAGAYYSIAVLAHHVFGGVGMALLLRRFEVGPLAQALGVLLFMSSGPWISVANMLNLFLGTSWLPWMMLAADHAAATPGVRTGALWGGSIAACLLTCSEPVFMGGLISGAWFLFRIRETGQGLARSATTLLVALAFSFALSAGQWWPLVEALGGSPRARLEEEVRTFASLHPLVFVQLFIPFVYRHLPLYDLDAFADFSKPLLSTTFLGGGAVLLAVAGAKRGGRGPVLGVAAAAALLVAGGRHSPFYDGALSLLPFMGSLRFPVKATIAFAFLASILAARAFERLEEHGRLLRIGAAGFAGAQLLLLAAGPTLGEGLLDPHPNPMPFWLFDGEDRVFFHEVPSLVAGIGISIPCLAILASAAAARRGRRRAVAFVAVALPPLVATAGHNDFAPVGLLTLRPRVVDFLRADGAQRVYFALELDAIETGRVPPGVPVGPALAANVKQAMPGTVQRIFGFRGSFEMDLKNTHSLPLRALRRITTESVRAGKLPVRLLRIAGVSHVILVGDTTPSGLGAPAFEDRTITGLRVRVLRVPNPLPLCVVADGVRALDGAMAARDLMEASYDPARTAIAPEVAPRVAVALRPGSCVRTEPSPNEIEARVVTSAVALAVLTDSHDPNWTATVDGVEAPVVRANFAFMGVEVPPGAHTVRLLYRPRSVYEGLAASSIAAVLFMLATVPLRSRDSGRDA